MRLFFLLLALGVGLLLRFVGEVAEHFFLQHLPAFSRHASFGLRLPSSALLQEIFNILDQLIIFYPALLSPQPAIDRMLIILFGQFLILLLEDAVIPLKEILLHHGSLQFSPQYSHLRPVCLILSDEAFNLFLVNAVELVGF